MKTRKKLGFLTHPHNSNAISELEIDGDRVVDVLNDHILTKEDILDYINIAESIAEDLRNCS